MKNHLAITCFMLLALTGCKSDTVKVSDPVSDNLIPLTELDNEGNYNGAWLAQVISFDHFGDIPINTDLCSRISKGGFYYLENGTIYPFLSNYSSGSVSKNGRFIIDLGKLRMLESVSDSQEINIELIGKLSSYTNQGTGSVDTNIPGRNEKCLAAAYIEKYTQIEFSSGNSTRIDKFIWAGKQTSDAHLTTRFKSISEIVPFSISSEETKLNCKGFWLRDSLKSREGKALLRCNDSHTLEAKWSIRDGQLFLNGKDNYNQQASMQLNLKEVDAM